MTKRGAAPRFWLVSSSRTAVSSRLPSSSGAGRGTLLRRGIWVGDAQLAALF